MAFWMDPFLLILSGLFIAYIAKRWYYNSTSFVPGLSGLVLAIFYFISGGMFCNLDVLSPSWRLLGCQSGTGYMINGIIFDLVEPGASWAGLPNWGMFACITMFVLYPLWLWLGIKLGRKKFGKAPV